MPDERRPDDRAPEPARFRTQAEIRFLVDQKESLVDQADAIQNLTTDHHAAAVDDIGFGRAGEAGLRQPDRLLGEKSLVHRAIIERGRSSSYEKLTS